jgi:hypothetical protein
VLIAGFAGSCAIARPISATWSAIVFSVISLLVVGARVHPPGHCVCAVRGLFPYPWSSYGAVTDRRLRCPLPPTAATVAA